jgi:hypothetical protein
MNKIITADYFPGQDCDCEARSSYECGCDADWTPVEVYKLREDAKQLADRLTALERERDEWKKAAFEIIEELERERDEARKEAHRFRSLHYSHLGINGSASWFPWEEKLGHE